MIFYSLYCLALQLKQGNGWLGRWVWRLEVAATKRRSPPAWTRRNTRAKQPQAGPIRPVEICCGCFAPTGQALTKQPKRASARGEGSVVISEGDPSSPAC